MSFEGSEGGSEVATLTATKENVRCAGWLNCSVRFSVFDSLRVPASSVAVSPAVSPSVLYCTVTVVLVSTHPSPFVWGGGELSLLLPRTGIANAEMGWDGMGCSVVDGRAALLLRRMPWASPFRPPSLPVFHSLLECTPPNRAVRCSTVSQEVQWSS